MRHPSVEAWEENLNRLLRQVDNRLEEEFGALFPLHPARPRRGQTANPQQDGLFRVTAGFTTGFGSRHGKGYEIRVDTMTLQTVPADLRGRIETRAVGLIRDGLEEAFPNKKLDVVRDGASLKLIGDLTFVRAPERPLRSHPNETRT